MVSLSSGSSEALSARRKLRALFRSDIFSPASPAAGHAQLTNEVWATAVDVQQVCLLLVVTLDGHNSVQVMTAKMSDGLYLGQSALNRHASYPLPQLFCFIAIHNLAFCPK